MTSNLKVIMSAVGVAALLASPALAKTEHHRTLPSLVNVPADAHASANRKMTTPVLTRLLMEAVEHQQPRRDGMYRPKMRYAHQGGMNPPIIVIHGTSLDHVTDAYKRFLEGRFRDHFKLVGTPLKIELRSGRNPFTDKED